MTVPALNPLVSGSAPRWALAWGEDDHGAFAVFAIGSAERRVEHRMRWIPPGTFVMGSPEHERGRFDDEGPQREVALTRGFWLGETPVTQALWVAVMADNPSHFRGDRAADLQRPVERTSWDDCQAFVVRLNAETADLNARLPTEAEWEYACRSDTTEATWIGELSRINCAAELESIAWYNDNSGGETHPVGLKSPNLWGLHDMLGNVSEWCVDVADGVHRVRPYAIAEATDPAAVGPGTFRVTRGGSWSSRALAVRAASRRSASRSLRVPYYGFRLAAGAIAPRRSR